MSEGAFPSVIVILIHCCNIWGLTDILSLLHDRSFLISLHGPPSVSRISSHSHFASCTACPFPHFPVFFYSRALLDSFPSPEVVSVLSWITDFPIISNNRLKSWEEKWLGNVGGQRFWTSQGKADILLISNFSTVYLFLWFCPDLFLRPAVL